VVNGSRLYVPKPEGKRYLNAIALTWQPRWTPGLYLGFTRAFYQYSATIPNGLDGYFPVLGSLFKNRAQDENRYGRDQLLSLFFRLAMPVSKAEVYGEFGRNDHSADWNDLLLEPEHARAYLIGLRKLFPVSAHKDVELFTEFTHLQSPSTLQVRELQSWYTHYQVRHGYTHKGQVLGAGIGTGGSSQTLGVSLFKGIEKTGFMLERVVHNNDFYYQAFASSRNYQRHWVDFSFSFLKSWRRKQFIYDAQLGLIRSLNYQWRPKDNPDAPYNATNLHTSISVGYLF
jgi:hypothetical protein